MVQPWMTWCRLCGQINKSFEKCISLKLHKDIGEIITKYLPIKDIYNSKLPDNVCLTCYKVLVDFDTFALQCEETQTALREILSVQNVNDDGTKTDIVQEDIGMTFDPCSQEFNIPIEYNVKITALQKNEPNVFCNEDSKLKLLCKGKRNTLEEVNADKISIIKMEVLSDKSNDQFSDMEFFNEPLVKVRKKQVKEILKGIKKRKRKSAESEKRVLRAIVRDSDTNVKEDPHSDENATKDMSKVHTNEDYQLVSKAPNSSSCLKYDCHVCHEDCRNWHALCIHFRDVHKARAKVMCICGKFLASRVSIGRHFAKHGKADSFNCPACGKRFPRASELEAHQVSHLPIEQRPYVCCKCARRFTSNQLLRHHERMHIPINQRMLHPCDLCNTKFATKSGLAMHIRAVHERLRPFVCDQCGRAFTTKGILEEHQVRHSDARPHSCDICSKSFKTKQRLTIHADTHGNTVYQCPHCPLKLNSRRTLRMHLFVHDEVCRYRCSFCEKAFKRAKDLKNHNNLHTGRRPYSCPWCPRTFANGSNCRAHKRRMHPIELADQETKINMSDGNTVSNETTAERSDADNHDSKLALVDEPKIIYTTVKRKIPLRTIIQPNFVTPQDVTEKESKGISKLPINQGSSPVKIKMDPISSDQNDAAIQSSPQDFLRFQNSEISIIPLSECKKEVNAERSTTSNESEISEEHSNIPIIVSSFAKGLPQGCPFIQNNSDMQNLFMSPGYKI